MVLWRVNWGRYSRMWWGNVEEALGRVEDGE